MCVCLEGRGRRGQRAGAQENREAGRWWEIEKILQDICIIFCTQGGGEPGVKGRGNPIVGSVQLLLHF